MSLFKPARSLSDPAALVASASSLSKPARSLSDPAALGASASSLSKPAQPLISGFAALDASASIFSKPAGLHDVPSAAYYQPKTRSSLLLHSRSRWHDYNHLLIGVYLLRTSIDVRKIVCTCSHNLTSMKFSLYLFPNLG